MQHDEIFEASGVTFEFAADGGIYFQDGFLCARLIASGQAFDPARHTAFENRGGVAAPAVEICNMSFPTPKVERSLEYPADTYSCRVRFDGFASAQTHVGRPQALEFAGTLRVADGWLTMQGAVREEIRHRVISELIIRKRFEAGPIDPRRHVHHTLESALSVDPMLVAHLRLLQSGQAVPPELFQLRHLESLLLRYFGSEELPDMFDCLPDLRRLDLMDIPLRSVPASIGELRELRHLELFQTKLASLPDCIGDLASLRRFSLHGSQVSEVPEALFRLPRLSDVTLAWSKLESLPENVGTAPALERIYLHGNPFSRLPRSLSLVPSVDIEERFKPLYTLAKYRSKNRKKIQAELYDLSGDHDQLRSLDRQIAERGLTEFRTELLGMARRGIVLTSEVAERELALGRTRLGGQPDLPANAEYPVVNGEPLVFLAQLNLEELAKYQDYLPRTGLLSFFALFADEEDFAPASRVMYFHDVKGLSRIDSPQVVACRQEPYRACAVRAHGLCSLPTLQNSAYQLGAGYRRAARIEADAHLSERYAALRTAQSGAELSARLNAHGINKHVYAQIETPEQQAANALGGSPEEWMVLLSLASDDQPGFCFVDGGTLTFCVHKRDLAIADFSKVVAFIES